MVALQDIEHQHVRPKIGLAAQAGERLAGAEPAVVALRVHGRVDPLAGLGDDGLVLEHVAQIAVALEPVGQLLPAEVAAALLVGPGTLLEIQPGRDLGQVADHAVFLQLQLPAQPSVRNDAADGQFDEGLGASGSRLLDVVAVAGCRCREYRQRGHRPGRP